MTSPSDIVKSCCVSIKPYVNSASCNDARVRRVRGNKRELDAMSALLLCGHVHWSDLEMGNTNQLFQQDILVLWVSHSLNFSPHCVILVCKKKNTHTHPSKCVCVCAHVHTHTWVFRSCCCLTPLISSKPLLVFNSRHIMLEDKALGCFVLFCFVSILKKT